MTLRTGPLLGINAEALLGIGAAPSPAPAILGAGAETSIRVLVVETENSKLPVIDASYVLTRTK